MKVFISWSGDKSKKVAELVDEWLQCTIQNSEPWLSSRSIDRGALWFSEITAELADTKVGIICLTQENKDKPWILFESGALAKGLNSNRVCTLLIDLLPSDLQNPLAQFNHTTYDKGSLQQLLSTINSLSENPLKPHILEKVFDKYWSEFEERFNTILLEEPVKPEDAKRQDGDVLTEILNTVRGLDRRMVRVENSVETSSTENKTVNTKWSKLKSIVDNATPIDKNLDSSALDWKYDFYNSVGFNSLKETLGKMNDEEKEKLKDELSKMHSRYK